MEDHTAQLVYWSGQKKAFNQPAQEGCDPMLRFDGYCWSTKHTSPFWCLTGASEEQKKHEMQGTDRSAPSAAREKPLLNMFYKYLRI